MHDNAAILDQIPVRDDLQRRECILFDQQNRQLLFLVDLLDDAEDLEIDAGEGVAGDIELTKFVTTDATNTIKTRT